MKMSVGYYIDQHSLYQVYVLFNLYSSVVVMDLKLRQITYYIFKIFVFLFFISYAM